MTCQDRSQCRVRHVPLGTCTHLATRFWRTRELGPPALSRSFDDVRRHHARHGRFGTAPIPAEFQRPRARAPSSAPRRKRPKCPIFDMPTWLGAISTDLACSPGNASKRRREPAGVANASSANPTASTSPRTCPYRVNIAFARSAVGPVALGRNFGLVRVGPLHGYSRRNVLAKTKRSRREISECTSHERHDPVPQEGHRQTINRKIVTVIASMRTKEHKSRYLRYIWGATCQQCADAMCHGNELRSRKTQSQIRNSTTAIEFAPVLGEGLETTETRRPGSADTAVVVDKHRNTLFRKLPRKSSVASSWNGAPATEQDHRRRRG